MRVFGLSLILIGVVVAMTPTSGRKGTENSSTRVPKTRTQMHSAGCPPCRRCSHIDRDVSRVFG
jgi:hypothetical protein